MSWCVNVCISAMTCSLTVTETVSKFVDDFSLVWLTTKKEMRHQRHVQLLLIMDCHAWYLCDSSTSLIWLNVFSYYEVYHHRRLELSMENNECRPHRVLVGKWVKHNQNIHLCTYLYFSETHLQSNILHLIAETSRTHARMCLLGFLILLPI